MVNRNDDLNRAAQFLPFDALKGLSEEIQSRIERRSRIENRVVRRKQRRNICGALQNKARHGNQTKIL